MPPRSAPAPRPEFPVDPKLKKRWDTLSRAIAAAVARDARAFDERWEAAAQIIEHEPPLYVFGGYASPADFYREVLHEAPRNATRFMRVAKLASPADEQKYGVTKIDAAIAWLEAKQGEPIGKSLPTPLAKLRIAVTRDGKARTVSLAEATAAEINAATRAILAKSGKSRAAAKERAQTKIEAALRKAKGLDGVKVRVAGGLLHVGAVPLASWTAFRAAIASLAFEDVMGDGAAKAKAGAKKRAR